MSSSYAGSCHCGAVRYTAEVDLTAPVVSCNCSICGRSGWLLAFVPSAQFHLEAGADSLTDYQFAKHHIHHTFCKVCGVRPFSRGATPDGGEMIAVNVRCLDGVDPSTLTIKTFDGKSL
ncbi:MAG: GFA family protein [Myxococcales bacterium]|nr:GFA family protein [Myxococcales bacterium]